jgi:hypothetical protein
MKNKRLLCYIFPLAIVAGLILGVYLSLYVESRRGPHTIEETPRPTVDAKNPINSGGKTLKNASSIDSKRLAALTQTMQRARDIGLSLNAPMEFHGRIIDQYGKPVPGISAEFKSIFYNAVVLATYEPHKKIETRVSDENGEFHFNKSEGVTLSVSLKPRLGLRYEKFGSWSHSFQSDKQSGVTVQPTSRAVPFIFHVYRLEEPAEIREGLIESYLEADKRVYEYSLATQKVVEIGKGDFQVSVWQDQTSGQKGRFWGISIAGKNIQLLPTEDPFLYYASVDGYQSNWDFSWADDVKGFRYNRDFKFWIKQGESYGSLSVECVAFWKDKFRLIVRSSINLKPGDPNLQPVLPDWPPNEAGTKK